MQQNRNVQLRRIFRYRLRPPEISCSAVVVDALEPVEKPGRGCLAGYAKARSIGNTAVGCKKCAAFEIPHGFSERLYVFWGFLRGERNRWQECKPSEEGSNTENNRTFHLAAFIRNENLPVL